MEEGGAEELKVRDLLKAGTVPPWPEPCVQTTSRLLERLWRRPAGCSAKLFAKFGLPDDYARPDDVKLDLHKPVYAGGRFVRLKDTDQPKTDLDKMREKANQPRQAKQMAPGQPPPPQAPKAPGPAPASAPSTSTPKPPPAPPITPDGVPKGVPPMLAEALAKRQGDQLFGADPPPKSAPAPAPKPATPAPAPAPASAPARPIPHPPVASRPAPPPAPIPRAAPADDPRVPRGNAAPPPRRALGASMQPSGAGRLRVGAARSALGGGGGGGGGGPMPVRPELRGGQPAGRPQPGAPPARPDQARAGAIAQRAAAPAALPGRPAGGAPARPAEAAPAPPPPTAAAVEPSRIATPALPPGAQVPEDTLAALASKPFDQLTPAEKTALALERQKRANTGFTPGKRTRIASPSELEEEAEGGAVALDRSPGGRQAGLDDLGAGGQTRWKLARTSRKEEVAGADLVAKLAEAEPTPEAASEAGERPAERFDDPELTALAARPFEELSDSEKSRLIVARRQKQNTGFVPGTVKAPPEDALAAAAATPEGGSADPFAGDPFASDSRVRLGRPKRREEPPPEPEAAPKPAPRATAPLAFDFESPPPKAASRASAPLAFDFEAPAPTPSRADDDDRPSAFADDEDPSDEVDDHDEDLDDDDEIGELDLAPEPEPLPDEGVDEAPAPEPAARVVRLPDSPPRDEAEEIALAKELNARPWRSLSDAEKTFLIHAKRRGLLEMDGPLIPRAPDPAPPPAPAPPAPAPPPPEPPPSAPPALVGDSKPKPGPKAAEAVKQVASLDPEALKAELAALEARPFAGLSAAEKTRLTLLRRQRQSTGFKPRKDAPPAPEPAAPAPAGPVNRSPKGAAGGQLDDLFGGGGGGDTRVRVGRPKKG